MPFCSTRHGDNIAWLSVVWPDNGFVRHWSAFIANIGDPTHAESKFDVSSAAASAELEVNPSLAQILAFIIFPRFHHPLLVTSIRVDEACAASH